MPKDTPDKLSKDDIARRALNEHGFIFQNRISDLFLAEKSGNWRIAATELPVSLGPLHDETRVDIVLERHSSVANATWHIAVECKRALPDFKTWLFFDDTPRVQQVPAHCLFMQAATLASSWDGNGEPPLTKRVIQYELPQNLPLPLFNFYLEARENAPSRGGGVSSTKTIEDAFYQVTLGTVGLSRKLPRIQKSEFRVVPVVVTTAEIFAADFAPAQVSVARGEIASEDLKLRPLDWLCVNYSVSDKVAAFAALTTHPGRSLSDQLSQHSLRSVFVVRAPQLKNFLLWFDGIVDRNPW